MTEAAWHLWNTGQTVLTYDQRGHGESVRETMDPSLVHIQRFEQYIEDLENMIVFVHQHSHLPVRLFGHSMGGAVCACTASLYPEDIDRVVLSSPMIRPSTNGIPWPAALLTARMMSWLNPESYVPGTKPYAREEFEQSAGTSESRFDWNRDLREKDVHLQTAAPSVTWLKETAKVEKILKQTGRFPRGLLLQCESDAFVVNSKQDWFAQKAGLKQVVFKGARHELYNSSDDVLIPYWNCIEDFLKDR